MSFPTPAGCVADVRHGPGPTRRTGDLDVVGNVTIVGDDAATSIIDAGGIDRVFRVYPGATLDLQRRRA